MKPVKLVARAIKRTVNKATIVVISCLPLMSVVGHTADVEEKVCPSFLDVEFKRLHSNEAVNLCSLYHDKPLMIVNTASHCGFTYQFKPLEALYQKYQAQGVEVIGFASDDFNQAAKTEQEAANICYKNFGVTFTMLAPSHVKGSKKNKVFAHLAAQSGKEPSWNFNKYLVSHDGEDVSHYGSKAGPLKGKLEAQLQQLLKLSESTSKVASEPSTEGS